MARKSSQQHGGDGKNTQPVDHCAVDPHFENMGGGLAALVEYLEIGSGEVALWRRVILQCLMDFCGCSDKSRIHRPKAIYWLLECRADFQQVCDLANIPSHAVRTMAQHAASSPELMDGLKARIFNA